MDEQIDIAIITALKVEREAVVDRLHGVEKRQIDDEPLTFYVGTLALADGAEYRVLAVQARDMGNNAAAVATTRTIQRFNPQCVLMVGIAGGVAGKANLGDVVVGQYTHYYEFAKLKPEERENRPQQQPSDSLLYARAQHYDETDWRGDIRQPSPDELGFHPDVRFGPIACGDKVVESESELQQIREHCPKMLAVAMEGWGVALAVADDGRAIRFLEIRSISDQAIPGKNDDWHAYAANAAAAFCIGLLKTTPFRPLASIQKEADAKGGPPTLIVTAQSLRAIAGKELVPALEHDAQSGLIDFIELNFNDLVEQKKLTQPEEAARRVVASDGPFIQALAQHAEHQLAFHGLCSIPPVVLAGYVVSDRRPVQLFDFQPDHGNWVWPETDGGFPELSLEKPFGRRVLKRGDVAIRMSVTYDISAADVAALKLPTVASYHLSLPSPTRSIVRSEAQTLEYGRQFRALLDSLATNVPNAERVHLFYAGPMALAFNIGQQISENIHPPVIVWNYSRAYDWGINLAKAVVGEPCIVSLQEIAQ